MQFENVKTYLKDQLKDLRFFKTATVSCRSTHRNTYVEPNRLNPLDTVSSAVPDDVYESKKEFVKHVITTCARFTVSGFELGKTEQKPIRHIFYSDGMVDFELKNGEFSFELSNVRFKTVPAEPLDSIPGDLICVVPGTVNVNDRDLDRWFVCSPQFYNFWKMLFHTHHPSYKKTKKNPNPSVFDLKEWFMTGNRLVTDSHKKYVLACLENDIPVKFKESLERFYVKRHEKFSLENIDIYPLLALVAVYGESPSVENIPTTGLASDILIEPQRKIWDVEREEIEAIFQKANSKVTESFYDGLANNPKPNVLEMDWANDEVSPPARSERVERMNEKNEATRVCVSKILDSRFSSRITNRYERKEPTTLPKEWNSDLPVVEPKPTQSKTFSYAQMTVKEPTSAYLKLLVTNLPKHFDPISDRKDLEEFFQQSWPDAKISYGKNDEVYVENVDGSLGLQDNLFQSKRLYLKHI